MPPILVFMGLMLLLVGLVLNLSSWLYDINPSWVIAAVVWLVTPLLCGLLARFLLPRGPWQTLADTLFGLVFALVVFGYVVAIFISPIH